ncbi:MFS transporter [Latilactobacillus fuchuensis]|uniref:Glycoside/pentoside/hexuronide transporter n=1 Tax=Latilactobacillus fuchuensis TaxID=164393 RepID=A0A2N9DUW8_9LACO|nr:glycoside-pentoside-hexuronide (GPH):cation symporter [Latilactobacillus fuchuensis]SPC37988.1 Glycoside/pentoside/hexuronide transporter [Latilactobacillus fuchuensis]
MKASIPDTNVTHKAVQTDAQPFGLRDKIGYMFGDLGNCFILGLVNSFLMIYYTNVLGIAGGVVGILFLTARIIDAFADITVGRMADVAPLTPQGRFRPWIRRMKYPFCLITVVIFLPFVSSFPMALKIAYIFVTYLVYGIFLSTINIPYGSMASAISSDPDHRASLSTFRSLGSAIGGASTGFLIPIFMYSRAADGRQVVSSMRFFIIAIVCALLAFLAYNVTYKLTTERVQIQKQEKVSAKALLKGMFTNKALLSLVVVDLFIVINQILSGTTTTYLFNDYFHNKQAMSIALLFTYGTVILLAPFATWLIKRFGKKEASVVTLIFSSILYLIMYFLHIHNAWVYLVFMFVATLGYSLFNLMVWAFITDVIDYHQFVSGYREDGTVYGVNSFARKVGQALAGGIGGFMLQMIGYQSSTTGGISQSIAVENRIYALANLLPAILLLLAALVLAFFYPLNKKTINDVDAKLKEINQQEQQ